MKNLRYRKCQACQAPVLLALLGSGCVPDASDPGDPDPTVLALRAVTPAMLSTAGNYPLQLAGNDFVAGSTVTIDGLMPLGLVQTSATRLVATAPANLGAWGNVPVTVQNPDGQKVTRNDLFGYYASHIDFPGPNFPVGSSPIAVAVGDFNGDQKLDLAVANLDSHNLLLLLGNGLGGFKPAIAFGVGMRPISVVAADFNGDHKLDLAVANDGSNNVSVLLSNGLGSFDVATNFPTGTAPGSVTVGDFNGDQKPDLAVANYGSDSVSVLLGDGHGSFAAATNFPVGSKPSAVALGDFDGDQKLDLAVTNSLGNSVSVLLGTGSGGFGAATSFAVGTKPYSVAVGDANGN